MAALAYNKVVENPCRNGRVIIAKGNCKSPAESILGKSKWCILCGSHSKTVLYNFQLNPCFTKKLSKFCHLYYWHFTKLCQNRHLSPGKFLM